MWEDLCQLEGYMGMRYLTHETEDNFWTSHGAKPHPLAKVEAEKRTQIKLEQQQASEVYDSSVNTGNQRVAEQQPDQHSNGSQVSNGSVKFANDVFSGSGENIDETGVGKSNMSTRNREDYVSMPDEDVVKSQAHAERVGYKVSTV